MNSLRKSYAAKTLALFALALFVLPIHSGIAAAAEPIATTAIKHKPIQYFVPDNRIKINAEVTDKEVIKLVRCYFRAAGEAGYVFVTMQAGKEGVFESILPSPSKTTQTLEYLFLVVNEKNQVVRSQIFTVDKRDDDTAPAWQQVASKGDIHVSTELANARATLPGFSDSIALDVVESSARFGLVAEGIYMASQFSAAAGGATGTTAAAGGATGAAAAATSGGVVAASAGISTIAAVGIGAAVVAVAGGAAAAGSGGGSGGGDLPAPPAPPTPTPTPPPISGCTDIAGSWSGNSDGKYCDNTTGTRPLNMTILPNCVLTDGSTSSNVSRNGNNVSFSVPYQKPAVDSGCQGNFNNATFNGSLSTSGSTQAISGGYSFPSGIGGNFRMVK